MHSTLAFDPAVGGTVSSRCRCKRYAEPTPKVEPVAEVIEEPVEEAPAEPEEVTEDAPKRRFGRR